MFGQQPVQANNSDNSKTPHYWYLRGELIGDRYVLSSEATNAESSFVSLRYDA